MPLDRSSGLLLHISSLDSAGGIGDFGPAAFAFADFLAAAKQRLWQVLPLNPVGYGSSPYSSISAFAGNPLLISLEVLVEWGWLTAAELAQYVTATGTHPGRVDFEQVREAKMPLLWQAAARFLAQHTPAQWQAFEKYRQENSGWLEDFVALQRPPPPVRLRRLVHLAAGDRASPPRNNRATPHRLAAQLEIDRVIQFAFDQQWQALRDYCCERGIRFIGDVAIFVSTTAPTSGPIPISSSSTKTSRPSASPASRPTTSADRPALGQPPLPLGRAAPAQFDWWVDRIRRAHDLYDIIRLDHFRGFEAYWAIPAEEETAVHGEWVKCPGAQLFPRLVEALGPHPFIAEDLGLITPEVDALREQFGLPGMRVLQFGFTDRGAHNHLPHRYVPNTVAYTGTHDNDTTAGWWDTGATAREPPPPASTSAPAPTTATVWPLIRAAARSVADPPSFPSRTSSSSAPKPA